MTLSFSRILAWEKRQCILDEVFRRIRAEGLIIKCQFAQESVKFLGHIVSARGTEPDSSNVEAVREFATPTSLTDVRAFFGMASYYRRFIKNFADIAAPLHDLTKGGQPEFCWTPVADKAFNDLKSHLCSAPILSLPDFSVPFTIYTDASYFGLGAVLSQRRGKNEYVIAYTSQTLTSAERNYTTTEKECLGIVWTVNYWRPYLLGNTFDIVTDHQSLTWLQGLKEPNWSSRHVDPCLTGVRFRNQASLGSTTQQRKYPIAFPSIHTPADTRPKHR